MGKIDDCVMPQKPVFLLSLPVAADYANFLAISLFELLKSIQEV
jgi:hypothetical protein